ncbi:MAG: FG-GAP-like repeat-containing protein, partial [Sulfurovum sp.]|nr:FG-GAP-like repeat-containing protein [Sulfurovum sp.]
MVFSIGLYGAHHAFFSVIRFVKKALVGGFVLVSLLHAQPVVNLKGEMNVNQGALEYTFNLQLPPGIAGVVPKLSLTYNSNGGNGYLGKGWDLGGLSSITRCGSTIADDGISRSIQLDEKDHYCLDGQRLVAVAGAEGADGTEYRTKIESYSRIVSYGGNGDNPQTFKVWTKSGDVYEYGAVPNARFDYEGKTVSWKVSKIRDALLNDDNAIEFVYTDEHVISSVNYANGINRIDFLYGTGRLDKRKANYRGKIILQDKNLEKILVSVNGTDIREYRLSYLSQSNFRDLLKLDSIRECVENECLEPLSFTWDTNVHADLQFNKLAAPLITSDSYKFKIADFNGDGISDIYKVRDDADHIFIMNAEGGIAYETDVNVLGEYDAIALVDFNGDGIVDIYERYRPLFSSHTDRIWINDGEGHFTLFSHPDIKSALKRIKFADIDDDSDMDIYELDSNGHDKIWINDGRGNFEQNGLLEIKLEDCVESVSDSKIDTRIAERDIAFYDADEDGDLDIFIAVPVRSSMFLKRFIVNIYRNDGNGAFSLLRSDITHAPSTVNDDEDTFHQFVELNGDGIPDIVHIETSNSTTQSSYIYLSDCNLHWNTQPLAIASSKKKIRLADLNGDGVTDIYHTYKNNSGIWINDGKGNFSLDPNDQNINKSDDSYKSIDIVDLDGDGIVDIVEKGLPLFLEPRENNLWLNDGMGSFSAFRISQAKIDFSYTDEHFNVLYGDFNGDGLVDIYDTKTGIYLNANKQEKIVAITDSFKNVINITYDTLANNELYTKENDVKEKEVNLQTSAAVVASTEVGNGIGGIQKMSYRYSGLKYHLMRGPLGFRTVETTDETTGAKTLTEFYQAYPLTGRAKRTQSFIGDEILSDSSAQAEILISINGSWSIADNPSSLANRPDRYIIQNRSEEMKSFINDILLKETLTEYKEYDEYGNVEEMRVTTTGGGETFVKTTISSYENIVDGEKWLPGRLTNVSVIHEGYGDTRTRTSSFSYNEYGMLQSETIEPDDALEFTKSYTYDRFGNKIQEKLSSSSVLEDRITGYTYDDNGRFIVKVTNALGQEENSLYDENEGKRVSLTGPNGLSTRWEYNEWGQLTKEVRADGTFTTMSYTYDNSQNNSLYVITKSSSDGKTESIYYDSFDRVVATKTLGFEGEEIFVETSYNAKGQVEAKSSPHSLNDENVGYIRYIYDTYGRVTETLTPPHNTGDTGEISTKAEYDGYEVKTIDAENREKIVKKDAMDKIVSVQEGESSMEYSYDAIGNLVKTVPNGDETRAILMEYDILGNKTKMADPNMGTWTYTYNALGEPVSQKDAKAQTTTMHYDRLGRLTEKKTPEGTSVRQYDLGQKAIGKLSYESSGNISKAYAYDAYGRPASVTTAIDGLTYSEAYVYNEKGQLEAVTKPNNFKLVNIYNAYGYLESIKSPREQILDFDFDHYVNLIAALLQRATEYQTLYMEYQAKADELKAKAGYYESVAQANESESAYFNEVAVQLRAAAAQYEASAEINRNYADQAKAQADKYQVLADKYAKSIFTRSQSYTYQKLADRYYADTRHYLELAQQYALDAQNTLDAAQANDEQAQQLARNAESSINLAQDALALMQEDLARADHYQRLAENNTQMSEAYNEMLADEENVYHYKVLSMDSFGRVTQYLSGNGLINTDSYDDSGAMLGSQTGFMGDNAIRDLSYEYDKTYNLAKRTDSYLGVTAEYTYDALSRIEHARFVFENGQNITGMSDMSYAYDAFGNITHKSDIGEYAYDDALHPNRLSSVYNADTGETKTFEYDANGNMVNDNGI